MSKPRPTLPQMPWNVKKLIVSSADTKTKLSLRPCSKDFSNHVNNTTLNFYSLYLHITSRYNAKVTLLIDFESTHTLAFRYSADEVWVESSSVSKLLETSDYEKTVVEQCVKLFRNPRVSLKTLGVQIDRSDDEEEEYHRYKTCLLEQLEASLVSLNRPISVEEFSMGFEGSQEDVLRILPHLEPTTLKRIRMKNLLDHLWPGSFAVSNIDMSQMAETEQWKRAKSLMFLHRTNFSVENVSHFYSTVMVLHDLTLETVEQIYQAFVNSNQWTHVNILYEGNCMESAIQHFSQLGPQEPDTGGHGFRISIPRSNKYMVVTIGEINIHFRKYE